MKIVDVTKVLATFLIFNISALTSANASAEGAKLFIKEVSNKAIELIKDENTNELLKEQQLSKLFEDSVDTKWISKFVMGKYWRDASIAQRRVYLKLHRQFLIKSYVPKFKDYTNQQIFFKNFFDEGNNEYLIETEIVQTDGTAVKIDYKVKKTDDNKYLIFDVVAEGVSLITTQRSEFASILSRKGVAYLIKRLKAKV
jgi:phospholipid transport system substrate-binding protein